MYNPKTHSLRGASAESEHQELGAGRGGQEQAVGARSGHLTLSAAPGDGS